MQAALLHNGGDGPAPYKLNLKFPDALSKVAEVVMAMRSSEGLDGNKRIVDLVNETGWARCPTDERGWDSTLGTDTSSVNDSLNGGSGNSAKVDGTGGGHQAATMLRRVRLTRTTKLESLRGEAYILCRLRASAASTWEIQLRSSSSLAEPPQTIAPAVPLDVSGASVFSHMEIPLGFLRIPEETSIGGVTLEIWARRTWGSGDLFLNLVRLLPATPGKDVLTRIVVPLDSPETWLGNTLVTPTNPGGLGAGTISGDTLILDAAGEAGGVPPTSGLLWPEGRHFVTFKRGVLNTLLAADYTVRIRNITDNNDVISQALDERFNKPITLAFGSVAGKAYQPQIVCDSIAGGNSIAVLSITHQFGSKIASTEEVLCDPLRGVVEKLDASGALLTTMAAEGAVPFWVPPGLAAVTVVPLDVPQTFTTEGESVKARTLTFQASAAPRFVN